MFQKYPPFFQCFSRAQLIGAVTKILVSCCVDGRKPFSASRLHNQCNGMLSHGLNVAVAHMSWLAPNSHWSSFQRSVTQSFQHLEVETAVFFFSKRKITSTPRTGGLEDDETPASSFTNGPLFRQHVGRFSTQLAGFCSPQAGSIFCFFGTKSGHMVIFCQHLAREVLVEIVITKLISCVLLLGPSIASLVLYPYQGVHGCDRNYS